MDDKLTILLVDDMSGMEDQFKRLFRSIGITADIHFVQPRTKLEFLGGAPIPRDQALECYDVALVDLEFFYPPDATLPEAKKHQGGTEALPVLRQEAPWLPVIAESRLIDGASPELIPIAASFGFDGLFPQTLLNPDAPFNRGVWDHMYRRAIFHRRVAAIGPTYDGESLAKNFTISDADRATWEDHGRTLETLLSISFHFARDIAITAVKPGLSGARVYRAVASGGDQQDTRPGYWLVKVSSSPWKLSREVARHLEMTRGGEFAIAVPLLWRGVLVENRFGLIAYHFASGTVPAAEHSAPLPDVMREVSALLSRFYPKELSRKPSNRDVVLRTFGPSPSDLARTLEKLPPSFRPFANAIVDDRDGTLAQPVEYQECRIHGDLHLGNIMLGDAPVLIDFAWSRIGPIASDAARLAADLLVRHPEWRERHLPQWNAASKLASALRPVADVFRLQQDDLQLFSDFLSLSLWELLGYESTDGATRKWIREVLSSALISRPPKRSSSARGRSAR